MCLTRLTDSIGLGPTLNCIAVYNSASVHMGPSEVSGNGVSSIRTCSLQLKCGLLQRIEKLIKGFSQSAAPTR